MEFEAPRDDTKDYDKSRRLLRRYFFMFPIVGYVLYDSLLKRKNVYSKRSELKFFSEFVETKIGEYSER